MNDIVLPRNYMIQHDRSGQQHGNDKNGCGEIKTPFRKSFKRHEDRFEVYSIALQMRPHLLNFFSFFCDKESDSVSLYDDSRKYRQQRYVELRGTLCFEAYQQISDLTFINSTFQF